MCTKIWQKPSYVCNNKKISIFGSKDQYKFVYDTLEEHIVCGKTWFSVSELSERLKAKASKDPVTKMNRYQEEYAQICKQTPRYSVWLMALFIVQGKLPVHVLLYALGYRNQNEIEQFRSVFLIIILSRIALILIFHKFELILESNKDCGFIFFHSDSIIISFSI